MEMTRCWGEIGYVSSYLVVMWLSFEHYKLINLLAGLPFEDMMQGYMETDPSLEEMELDELFIIFALNHSNYRSMWWLIVSGFDCFVAKKEAVL